MTTKTQTTLASAAGMLWKVIESYNKDPEPYFRKAHIDPRLINDPSARFSLTAMDNVYHELYQQVDDPCMGLKLASVWHPSHLASLGYAWLASSTLYTALNRLSRYVRIINDAISVSLEEEGDNLVITITSDDREIPAHYQADSSSAILITMCRANYGEELSPVSVSFKHATSPCSGEYYGFFRCPVEFGAKQNQIILPLDVVNKRLTSASPQLAQINDQVMINYLADLDDSVFLQVGGSQTLTSYGLPLDMPPADIRSHIPQEHLSFFYDLPLLWEDRYGIYVHAGLQPGVHLSRQTRGWCLWVRDEFIQSSYNFGKPVIFGHTVFKKPLIQKNKIGIDTGAVYGKKLTALLLPEMEFVSVPGEQEHPYPLPL